MALLPYASRTDVTEAGCDEAGRGCLAGPVFAAAVILPPGFSHPGLDDSKKLTGCQRDKLRVIIEQQATAWGVGIVTEAEIDAINILNASILAMHRALDSLGVPVEAIAVDGNRFKEWKPGVPWTTYVKGDGRFGNIAAASILAKTYRDEWMMKLHSEYPQYRWDANKGYPTRAHRAAIAAFGPSQYHRMTFTLLPQEQPTLPGL